MSFGRVSSGRAGDRGADPEHCEPPTLGFLTETPAAAESTAPPMAGSMDRAAARATTGIVTTALLARGGPASTS